ncbi:sensor domain-containing diguanylate cyclase [Saccharibacillus deserti]|uniref:sensor domain-containing diguanylate cyclase n=1 Tax=Saccharibacillus deserti TaxID=1634444 RepID=UPI001554483E|nr:sensor domain-containing diguanylate cyclase [Saccharibacillus deserti]
MIIQDIVSREPFQAASRNIMEVLRRSIDVQTLFIAVNDKVDNFILTAFNRHEQLVEAGTSFPFEHTYCKLACANGKLAVTIPDTENDPLTAVLGLTRKLGKSSFIGVPIRSSSGEAFGTICAIDKRPKVFTAQEVELFHSMSELLSHVLSIEYAQYKDEVTDVFNRRFIDVVQRTHDLIRHPLGALCIDLKDFKEINSTYGHAYGDSLLVKCASILAKLCGEDSAIVRLQGDRFIVLLPNSLPMRMAEQAQTLLTGLERIDLPSGERLSVSIGAAFSDSWTASINDLIHRADTKMLSVKLRSGHGFAY